ncbi:MAG TPA: glycosyltransferase [Bacteroidales bacterium]|nr:glycosyltransferase [Bacteroidales bacterium]
MHLYALILIIPYFLSVLFIFNKLRKIKPFQKGEISHVSISIIVACRNEAKRITHLLETFARQDYPTDLYEIIVIDDNSADNTIDVVSSFPGIKNIRVIQNSGSGKKMAIMTGISNASGELIITTDADCLAGIKWISTIASFYQEHKPDMMICPVKLNQTNGFFGRFQELEFMSLQAITAGTAAAGHPTICNGANLAFTKRAYLGNSANLRFDIPTGDDVFLLHSMKKEGAAIEWLESNDAIVYTEAADGIKAFFRQRKRWASKGTAYKDIDSIFLGIVTFVTICCQVLFFAAALYDIRYILLFIPGFIIKSIPDFLILRKTLTRYNSQGLLKWFIPSQLIYPFYVLVISLSAFIPSRK